MADDIKSFLALRDDVASPVRPKLVAGPDILWDEECDVLVVGFGLAGACAAIEAADQGFDVLLIDRFRGGGSSEMSGGVIYAGGGTPVQQACNVKDSPAAMADYLLREVAGVVSDATVRKFCDESIETLDFVARQGVHFSGPAAPRKTSYPPPDAYLYYSDNSTVPAYLGKEPPAERGHRCKDPALVPGAKLPMGKKPHGGFTEGADMGWHMMAAMKRAVAEHPGIRVHLHCRAERLVADESGTVLGAELAMIPDSSRAARQHGWAEAMSNKIPWQLLGLARPFIKWFRWLEDSSARRSLVSARRGVILAAGGYIRNKAIMMRYAAPYLRTFPVGSHGDDGAGIRLGVSAGGVADHLDKISAWRFVNPPFEWTKGIIIGRDGTRITNEEQYGAHMTRDLYEQSGGKAWLIVDQQTWDGALAEAESPEMYGFQTFPVKQAKRSAVRAVSIEALAKKLGVPTEPMLSAIEAYSEAVRSSQPDPMGKGDKSRRAFDGGPYYAISLEHKVPTNPITSLSMGGLRVDEATGAVVDRRGAPIEGLYAAGRTALGIPSNNYVSGLSLADCVWSGRRAARAIAEKAMP